MAMEEEMTFEVDMTDPSSVSVGHLINLTTAETADDVMALVCENPGESSLIPDEEGLAAFAGIEVVDLSGLTFEVTEEDGVAFVVPDGVVVLNLGEVPASLLMTQLGVESFRLEQNDDGEWLICPAAAE
jgi:hypothetical protein